MSDEFLQGIDVSHNNGIIDWDQVAADRARLAFAYAKATEGCTFVDPRFGANQAGIKAAGLLRGAYHMFHPTAPAREQAQHFLETVGQPGSADLAPMLDVETLGTGVTPAGYAGAVAAWLELVGSRLGCKPLIYTSAAFWNDNLGSFRDFDAYPLWIAEYTTHAAPRLPTGAARYALWQYSAAGHVAGIAGSVDLDRFNGGPDALRASLIGAAHQAVRGPDQGSTSTLTPMIQAPAARA